MRIATLEAGSWALVTLVWSLPLWGGEAPTSAAASGASAVWMPKELTFVYMGFTSHYSCDGLLDKMRRVLLMLGARSDLDVTRYGCSSSYGTPDHFPGVRIKMNVLAPAPNGAPPAAPVPAQWKSVEVRLNKDPLHEAGDCELIEQIKQKILPQFTTRNIEFNSNCVPNQLSAGGTWLRAEVLTADQKDDKALASK